MPEVTMSVEEYLQLIESTKAIPTRTKQSRGTQKPKRKGKKDPKMARALKKANSLGRKKGGGYKKGYSQAKIMTKAHQLRRKM